MKPRILIGGESIAPAENAVILETEPGVYSVLLNGASYEVRVGETEVSIDGIVVPYAIEDPRQWSRSGGAGGARGRAALAAPMPGKVVRILVAVGDAVESGQGIVVVEAMKMQNEMKSPCAGQVTAIEVAEGDSVNAGAVLAVIGQRAAEAG